MRGIGGGALLRGVSGLQAIQQTIEGFRERGEFGIVGGNKETSDAEFAAAEIARGFFQRGNGAQPLPAQMPRGDATGDEHDRAAAQQPEQQAVLARVKDFERDGRLREHHHRLAPAVAPRMRGHAPVAAVEHQCLQLHAATRMLGAPHSLGERRYAARSMNTACEGFAALRLFTTRTCPARCATYRRFVSPVGKAVHIGLAKVIAVPLENVMALVVV